MRDNLDRQVNKEPQAGSGVLFGALRLLAQAAFVYPVIFFGKWIPVLLSTIGMQVGLLDPLRVQVVFSFMVIAALRHSFWGVYLINTYFSYAAAVQVAAFNFVVGDIITLFCLWISGARPWGSALDWIAVVAFLVGSCLETGYELQRKAFKDDSRNKGKLFTTGLASLSMHPNYFGYTLWRVALPLTAGNAYVAVFLVAFFCHYFVTQAIPVLQDNMQKHYKDQYEQYKRKTKKFIPFIY